MIVGFEGTARTPGGCDRLGREGTAMAAFNFARARYDWGDPRMLTFAKTYEHMFAVATASSGFIWLMPSEELQISKAAAGIVDARSAIVLSTWKDAESIYQFTCRGVHGAFIRRGAVWFQSSKFPTHVIWPIERSHRPSVAEGMNKLEQCLKHGPSPDGFNLSWMLQQHDFDAPQPA